MDKDIYNLWARAITAIGRLTSKSIAEMEDDNIAFNIDDTVDYIMSDMPHNPEYLREAMNLEGCRVFYGDSVPKLGRLIQERDYRKGRK